MLIRILGRLVEATKKAGLPEGSAWRVQIIDAGVSQNGNDYPLDVLHRSAHLFEGAKILARSDQEHVRNDNVSAELTIGWIEDVTPNGTGLEGTAIFHGGGKSGDIRETVLASWKLGKRNLVGLSIVADGVLSKIRQKAGRVFRAVEEILSVRSVDVVVNPAAGGRFLQLVAGYDPAQEGELIMLKQLLALIEAHDPKGYKTIDQDNIDEALVSKLAQAVTEALIQKAKVATEKLAEAQKPAPAATPAPADNPDLASLKADLKTITEAVSGLKEAIGDGSGGRALEELAAMKFETMFDSMFAESSLPDEAKDHILARIPQADRLEKNRDKLAEAIKDERKYFFKREGFDGIPSIFAEAEVTADAGEKFVAALTGLFTKTDEPFDKKKPKETVPRLQSIREAYAYVTGDTRCTGRASGRNGGSVFGMMYEAAQTLSAQWGFILGDSITRAMMKDYREYPLQDWKKIVNVVPVGDFRTQHRTQIGGFPTLLTVAAGAPYLGFTDVPDDFEATYSVSKKGNTQAVTLEMITNDDVGQVSKIPKAISRAALRTLSSAIWALITSNANLALSGDATALFTVGHGNTTAVFEAMALTSIIKGRTSMMKQTMPAGVDATPGEQIGIGPKYIAAAVDLEQTMFELIYSTGQPVLATGDNEGRPNFLQRLGLEPIVIPGATDTDDWFMIADPTDIPTIEVGFLGGREEPELFVQDMPNNGSMFSNDALTYKVRHIYGTVVEDFRGMYGQLN